MDAPKTNEGSPLINSSLPRNDSADNGKPSKAYLQRLCVVVVVAFLLAAAGERASISDFLNDKGHSWANSSTESNHTSNIRGGDGSDASSTTDPTSENSTDVPNSHTHVPEYPMRQSCQVLDLPPGRSVRMIQTAKGDPSAHYNPIPCQSVLDFTGEATSGSAQIDVDFTAVWNKDRGEGILGFGGAFTEASALNFHSLSEAGQEAAMELLFGENGLGYSMGRVHMNSCDFCVKSYSFDDEDGDFQLEHFDSNVSHDVESGMINMMIRANEKLITSWQASPTNGEHKLRLVVSPWSPPAWMKLPLPSERNDLHQPGGHIMDHSKSMDGSAWPNCLREGTGVGSRYSEAWALYFSKFIDAYKNHGIDVWAVTVQNEPEFPAPWEACTYNPDIEGDFIAFHLGPKLSETHPDVKLFIFDHNKDHGLVWMLNLLDPNNPAAKFIDGTGIHWYAGGMDRLLDGAVGTPNMHKMVDSNNVVGRKNQIILGTEACHCPSTYYAGGDISIAWARAERYVHTILADLAAGSNGWIEWNLILDSVGGPNHLGNVCDAPLIAVPHRAKGAVSIPSQLNFEKVGHPFGPVIGDFKAPFVLQYDYGIPEKYLDLGIAVQPMYFYMGHISRHVRPGARPVHAIVGNSPVGVEGKTFMSVDQATLGGGLNDLARIGIEVTTWPCEGSTRQYWKYNEAGQFQVFGQDWLGNPTTSCLSINTDQYFGGLTLEDCDANGGMFAIKPSQNQVNSTVQYSQIVLQNSLSDPAHSCLMIQPLPGNGGALGPLGGAQVLTGNCNSLSASFWRVNLHTGEVISDFFKVSQGIENGETCLTTGWPFLQVGAFTPADSSGDRTIVVLNEANDAANFSLNVVDSTGSKFSMKSSIPEHAIQTYTV